MKTKCAACKAVYEYDETDAGTTIDCDCGAKVELPGAPAKALEVPKELPRKELGRCARCGGAVDSAGGCLACQIKDAEALRAAEKASRMAVEARREPVGRIESECGNCGRRIGKLESTRAWKGTEVCTACFDLLDRQTHVRVPAASAHERRAKPSTTGPALLTMAFFFPGMVGFWSLYEASQALVEPAGWARPVAILGLLGTLAGLAWFVVARLNSHDS